MSYLSDVRLRGSESRFEQTGHSFTFLDEEKQIPDKKSDPATWWDTATENSCPDLKWPLIFPLVLITFSNVSMLRRDYSKPIVP